ncbi:glycerophosphoinositol permease [Rhodosporidiobolus nylandii]
MSAAVEPVHGDAVSQKGGMGKVALIFATALFSDGYINAAAGGVNTILARLHPEEYGKNHYSTLFSGMAYLGTIVGMLSFGYGVDRFGRKWGMLAASTIMIVFTALSAGAYGAGGSTRGLFDALIAYRFLTGIGIGAEYPSGSVAASESTENAGVSKRFQHGLFIGATNAMIDLGFVVASFVPLVLYWIFGNNHLRAVWRLTFGLGIVPAALVLLWRLKMPSEPDRYKQSSIKKNVPYGLIARRYWKSFLGVSLCWFVYDFITYPFGLFSSIIVDQVSGGSDALSTVFALNLLINAFYLPGAIGGALLVDKLGPKKQLILFLCVQGAVGFIMAGAYVPLTKHIAAFAVVYGLFLSFGEAGPGDTLGLLAAKSFPTAARGQMYGLAAAIGKIGAYVGVWAFPAMQDAFPASQSSRGPFYVGSGLAFFSALIAFFLIPEAKLDGMTHEDEAFRHYLAENGYDVSQMGIGESTKVLQQSPLDRRSTEDEKSVQV